MAEETKKTAAKKTAAKKSTTKASSSKTATSKSTASKTVASKKETKKKDMVESDTVTKATKSKAKTATGKTATKKTTRKRAASPKIEIVDATDSSVVDVDVMDVDVAETPLADEPIVIEEPVTAIQIDDRTAGSGERHGGFLNMLYRHPTNRMASGVCGGIADYLGWDAMLVRGLWAVATFMTGVFPGVLAYGILSLLLPVGSKRDGFVRPGKIEMTEQNLSRASYGLIGLGVLILLSNIGVLSWLFAGARAVVGLIFWPAVLVTIGLLLLNRNGDKNYRATFESSLNSVRERAEQMRSNGNFNMPETGSLREKFAQFRSQMPLSRSRSDRMIAGVCGGIGRAVGVDANLIRIGAAIMTIATGGFPLLMTYFLLAVLLPSNGGGRKADEKLKEEITIIEHM